MAGETTITVIGNLTDDPELRFTPSGAAVAKFRVASTPRSLDRQSGEWKDGEPLFLACNVWRQAAENVAESLQRGARVIVSGPAASAVVRDARGREAHRHRAGGRRDRPVAAVRHGEGAEDVALRWRWRRLRWWQLVDESSSRRGFRRQPGSSGVRTSNFPRRFRLTAVERRFNGRWESFVGWMCTRPRRGARRDELWRRCARPSPRVRPSAVRGGATGS